MRIACVCCEPVSRYRDQGWAVERLARYYNPNDVADEVRVFSYGDQDWEISSNVRVTGFEHFRELEKKCEAFGPNIIRCYDANRPYCDYALILAFRLRVPSYLSLHDMNRQYYRRLGEFTVITAYTETLARRAARDLGREVETQLNGIDSNVFKPRTPTSIDERVAHAKYRIFTIGRDDPVKNISTAIQATGKLSRKVDSIAHVIAGPGTEKIGFDGVHLGLGPLSERMVAEYINWCMCFLQVQLVSDIGMAAAEALMIGRPVVLTGDQHGNAQYRIDENRGIIISTERVMDSEFISEALYVCLNRRYNSDEIRRWAIETYDAKELRKQEAERYLRLISTSGIESRSHVKAISQRLLLTVMLAELEIWKVRRRTSRALSALS